MQKTLELSAHGFREKYRFTGLKVSPVISHVRNIVYGVDSIMSNNSTRIIDSCLIRIESCFSAQGINSLHLAKELQKNIACQPSPRKIHRDSRTSMGTCSQNCLFDTIKVALSLVDGSSCKA